MFVLVQFGDTGQAARLFNSNVTRDSFLAFVHRSALREAAQYAKAVEHTEARCAASAQDQVNALEAAAAAMAEDEEGRPTEEDIAAAKAKQEAHEARLAALQEGMKVFEGADEASVDLQGANGSLVRLAENPKGYASEVLEDRASYTLCRIDEEGNAVPLTFELPASPDDAAAATQ